MIEQFRTQILLLEPIYVRKNKMKCFQIRNKYLIINMRRLRLKKKMLLIINFCNTKYNEF